uniref:Uncharacterized protein n=1 Tax=Trichinella nativa TaxID=6335 RepID=A0A0V1KH36_9BILA
MRRRLRDIKHYGFRYKKHRRKTNYNGEQNTHGRSYRDKVWS